MSRQHHFQIGHRMIQDPINPYLTDQTTEWSDDHKAYITTVYGKNQHGERVKKYQVRENPTGLSGPD